jgi:hypothetical protein
MSAFAGAWDAEVVKGLFPRPIDTEVTEECKEGEFVVGENGHKELTLAALGDDMLGLFDSLVRGASDEDITALVQKIAPSADNATTKALFLLAFQTRWCRGGKGEKKLFYILLCALFKFFPSIVLDVLDLVPHYGYWKDLFLLQEFIQSSGGELAPVQERVWKLCAQQHAKDLQALQEKRVKEVSLYAKYMPSEKSSLDKKLGAVSAVSKLVFAGDAKAKMRFRKDLSKLRQELNITERFMCERNFRSIRYETVPSACMRNNKLAFLNDVKCPEGDFGDEGTRFPDNEDRVQGRKNFVEFLVKGKVNGKQLFPHQLAEDAFKCGSNPAEQLVVNAQWKSVRENVRAQIESRKADIAAGKVELEGCGGAPTPDGVDPGNMICLSDVSGSMSGTPMMVSIAMGILCSELCHPALQDRVMTFESNPRLISFGPTDTFCQKVETLSRAPWGGSTDFYKALMLIGKLIEDNGLTQDQIPKTLMVVSDMQFNCACRCYDSAAAANVRQYFERLGERMHGTPFTPPVIVFWNVRATQVSFPAKADTEGVVLMSGFSPALLKFILSGELEVEDIKVDEETGVVDVVRRQINPAEMLQRVLQDTGLDLLRDRLDELLPL